VALRACSASLGRERRSQLKRFYVVIGGVMIAVVLTVLFVPGVRQSIERQVLGWLGSMAG
jgi:uncharacterized membrane protein HdeD (DUF308 family)